MTVDRSLADIEEIENILRERFLAREQDDSFVVRYLGTTGEVGNRCLTFNLEAKASRFEAQRASLEKIVENIRAEGLQVDELLQKLGAESAFDLRMWVMVYETTPNL